MPGKYKENELAQVPDLGKAVHKKPTGIPVNSLTETGLTAVVAMQLD